ncbi:PREDICTED: uncharacterized protein DDB_G0287625-like [Dinoponera quadriceps]|uniref:Uncharacterized protein DDB_G0287625-like n=1 Tax=Dinoponera quadriceps TaxID=609295 RepID=A0A6P3XP72_DINQU|nr:PREDICTED: uncharacterized protein DDB_G0287625-like [Dinoponera quadriceps]
MTRTFSLGLVVALLLVLAITDASRGRTNQTDEQKVQGRGSTRFYSQSTTELDNFPASATEASRPSRDKSTRSESTSELKRHESHVARESSAGSRSKPNLSKTTGGLGDATSQANARHSDVGNPRNRANSQFPKAEVAKARRDSNEGNVFELQTPRRTQAAPRRVSLEAPLSVLQNSGKLDLEVFTKSPSRSRSRTGRKIYPNFNEKELNSQAARPRKLPVVKDVESSDSRPERKEAKLHTEYLKKFADTAENILPRANVYSSSSRTDTTLANNNNNNSTDNNNNNNNEKIKERDLPLSGSESVRVDIPLTEVRVDASNPSASASVFPRQVARSPKEKASDGNDIARSSSKKSNRQSDRSKSRGRSKSAKNRDGEATSSTNASRKRGSSALGGAAAFAETNARGNSNTRGRPNAKNVQSRSRSSQKSRDTASEARSRSRYLDVDLGTSANVHTETRRSSSNNDRRGPEAKRRSGDSRTTKFVDTRTTEEQDVRAQSRARSRVTSSQDVTTAYIPKLTIAESTTVSSAGAEVTTSSSVSPVTRTPAAARTSTTDRSSRSKGRDRGESTRSKKPPKEDFFNHGLGFRGRKSSTDGTTSSAVDLKTTTPKSETQLRSGNPGWTLRRRPGHVNHDASSTTSIPINRDQANEVISSNDSLRSTPETLLSNAKAGRRGTKRPKAKDESNTVSGVTAKSTTRGSKTFDKTKSLDLPKKVEEESDNYPPAFRARLSQLKNSNSKPTVAKGITRTSSQAFASESFRLQKL